MEALFIFILKSSGLLATFYFAYIFLLRKETFFNSSRWFLIAGLITSVILPFVVYTKVIWVEAPPVLAPAPIITTTENAVKNIPISSQDVIAYTPQYKPTTVTVVEEENFEINWSLVLAVVYGIGFLAFLIKFALDFYSLNSVLKGKKIEQQNDFKFIDVDENIAPFSYFDYIVYNSSLYTAAELENILEHEKVHSDQKHTVDVLISRIFCILFWFNPIVWLYKKAILQNLEFIADSEASKKIADKKAYQYTLLKITTHETCVAITNHFYQSLIKKRIVMLNKNQSKKRNYWKYSAVIPALGAFVLLFQIKTIAQEKKQNEAVVQRDTIKDSDETIKITKNTTDKELNELPGKLKTNHNLDVEISDVKRNTKEELTAIQIKVKSDSGKKQTIKIDGDEAIKDCELAIGTDENGAKAIVINTDKNFRTPIIIRNEKVIVRNGDIVPPAPPTPPSFPSGPLPPAPAVDMSKMPKPPVAPKNPKDKIAMAKFEKDMEAFEKQMEAWEPQMDAYEKQIETIMSQREAIYEKEMAKYEIAMEKFSANMEKFNYDFKFNFGDDSKDYENSMKQYEQDMKQYELDMKQHAKDMKQHAKDMKQHEKDMKQHEKDMKEMEKQNKKA
ncbi:M56 family metallopeptidase [Flavobacterium sp. KACC 22763]|uniref:M56 family metallopeptidase n=1 Tax=Flavobacterium sp. KACC 22763 TaxID=3025668 RepID=UPI00236733C6|nr:M56 family metallopeptidase [Flavobacterium sp. KACC 22763]WDF65776.1 M56 family metallopeptidase [Flavobacterium sp. KACC 22763]